MRARARGYRRAEAAERKLQCFSHALDLRLVEIDRAPSAFVGKQRGEQRGAVEDGARVAQHVACLQSVVLPARTKEQKRQSL
eukprot:3093272-Rhodomonas_salina.2